MFQRALCLPRPGEETFFLWGPRQSGKSTLLKKTYPTAFWLDLLKADEFRRYTQHPERLREELAMGYDVPFVVIDEIQKIPALLDEVHWLHENRGVQFALCGSSARKVKRGAGNLLGGRAVRYELYGFSSADLGRDWDSNRMLNNGYLPRIYLSNRPKRLLSSYVGDYLKEEIAAEGIVRNLPAFSQFLTASVLSDTEMVNFTTIARDCGVSSPTVKSYFEILTDTLLGHWLPSYRKKPKRRVVQAPKFYFSDVGVVNFLSKREQLEPGSPSYGKAFENWCFHEINSYNTYQERFAEIAYWRLPSGIEVDFIVNDMAVAIEAKATKSIRSDNLKGLRNLKTDHPEVKKSIVVCLEPRPRKTEDDIVIMPHDYFVTNLWEGNIF